MWQIQGKSFGGYCAALEWIKLCMDGEVRVSESRLEPGVTVVSQIGVIPNSGMIRKDGDGWRASRSFDINHVQETY